MTVKLTIECVHCHRSLRVGQDHVGRRVRCTGCGEQFEITRASFSEHSPVQSVTAAETRAGEADSNDTVPDVPPEETRQDEPDIGQIGRFQLKEVLGGGGFGLVFRAHDPTLGRGVAVKVPRFARHETKKLNRFLLEARAAAKLRHPNIVTVFESGRSQENYYIASEYVPGVPLSELIKQRPPDFAQSAEWVSQLADALDYANREGILHRDIKPANIMIDAKNRPQIMDFGLAKLVDHDASETLEGSVLGTPVYMAPEQARGALEEIGPHSDQYSLGVVLYELLTGAKPFRGAPHEVIAQVLTETPPAPRQLNPEIPADLEAICLKAMEKAPAERYVDAGQLAEDLRCFLRGAPVQARSLGLVERARRWARRNPMIAGLTTTVALLLLVISLGAVAVASHLARSRIELARALEDAQAAREKADESAQEAEDQAATQKKTRN